MKKNRFNHLTILLLLLIVLISSCKQKEIKDNKSQGLKTIFVNPTKLDNVTDLLKNIDNIYFVTLENKSNNPIIGINKIWVTKDEYMILTDNQEFHKYNHNGKFILKKAVEGKGKGEIIDLRDFSPAKDGAFYLLSYEQYFHYDKSGKLLSTKRIEKPFQSFNPIHFYISKNATELYADLGMGIKNSEEEEYALCLINRQSKKSQKALRMHTSTIVAGNTFFQSDDRVIINPVIGLDTIYVFEGTKLIPLYYIDFGDYKIKLDELPKEYENPEVAFEYAKENNKCVFINFVNKCNDWLSFSFTYNDESYKALFNCNNEETFIVKQGDMALKNALLNFPGLASANGSVISSIPAYYIKDKIGSNSLDFKFLSEARHNEIIAQLKKVKETDNPVLMFVKMKKE